MKAGEKPDYPRFKGRNRYRSFTYPQWGNGASLVGNTLLLSKLGPIAVRWSRPLEGTPKTITISQEADGWYVCFSCAEVPVRPLPLTGEETGIDVGRESFLTLATGEQVANDAPLNAQCPRHAGTSTSSFGVQVHLAIGALAIPASLSAWHVAPCSLLGSSL